MRDPRPGQQDRRTPAAGVALRAVTCAVAVAVLVFLAGAAAPGSVPAAAPTSAAPSAGVLRYYIVGPPIDGRPEYLFDIAVRTLGTGRRYLEIFSLNEGRTQPDGARLEDPAVLHPGWILILPPDAAGPAVHTGPLPTKAGGILTSAAHSTGNTAAPAGSNVSDDLSKLLMFIVVTGIIVVALWLLRRGQRLTLPGRRSRARPRPHQLALTAGPATLRPAAPPDLVSMAGAPSVASERRPEPAVSARGGTAPPPPPLPLPPPPPSPPPAATQLLSSSPVMAVEAPAPHGSAPAPHGSAPAPHGSALAAEITLASGADSAAVQLAGIRLQQAQPAWMWLDPDAARPPSPTVVALGVGSDGALCVDVAQAPDVITVLGHLPGSRRLAASLARQLSDAGVAVTVVGTAIGASVTGVHTVATLTAAAEVHPSTEPHVVFCGATEDSDAAAIRQLTVRSKPRTVVVLVGPDRRSRWSIQVRPPRVDR